MWNKACRWMVRWELLIFILAAVISFRIPSLFEPYWYGDEGVYLTIGQAINKGVVLYSGIHDNKPPLLYWVAAVAQGQMFWFRLILLAWMLITILVFYVLAKRVASQWAIFCTLVFAILTTNPIWEGNIANAELFFLLPIIVGFYLALKDKLNLIVLSGVAYGIAILFKVPAIFSAGVWPIIWVWQRHPDWLKKCLLWGVGLLIPILISFGIANFQGALHEYTQAAWLQNIPYLSSWKSPASTSINTVKTRAIVVILGLALILGFNVRLGKMATLIGIWGVLDLFAATLSGRPYPHYLIQIFPALALGSGLMIKDVRSRWTMGGVMLLLVLTFWAFKFYTYPGINYYKNYLGWGMGQKNLDEYRGWFDGQVNNNYEISALVMALTDDQDRIFVWGDQPMIYAMARRLPCGKYIAKYHIKDFSSMSETLKMLDVCQPKMIVDFGGLGQIQTRYVLIAEVGGARVYKKL